MSYITIWEPNKGLCLVDFGVIERMIYLVSGSRSLVRLGAKLWVTSILRGYLSKPGSVLVTGFAEGPDKWSLDLALELDVPSYSYQPTGFIVSGDPSKKWCGEGQPPVPGSPKYVWRDWFLLRDRTMVDHLVKFKSKGLDVEVIGFVDSLSATHGTDYTLNYARDNGLSVTRLVHSP